MGAVLTPSYYHVSWHCTVSIDDCLSGGSILSEVGVGRIFSISPPDHLSTAGGDEIELGGAIYSCTAGVSVTGLSNGRFNP